MSIESEFHKTMVIVITLDVIILLCSFSILLFYRIYLRTPVEINLPDDNSNEIINMHFTEYTNQILNECIICQDPNNMNSVVCKCKNAYHISCIKKWLQKKNTCPVCRMVYIINDIEINDVP